MRACSPLPARLQSQASDTGTTTRMATLAAMAIATAKAAATAGYGNGHGHDERCGWCVTVDQVNVCHTTELSPAAQLRLAPVSQKPRLVCALQVGQTQRLPCACESCERAQIRACLCAYLQGMQCWEPAACNYSQPEVALKKVLRVMLGRCPDPGSKVCFRSWQEDFNREKKKRLSLFFDFAVLRWLREQKDLFNHAKIV